MPERFRDEPGNRRPRHLRPAAPLDGNPPMIYAKYMRNPFANRIAALLACVLTLAISFHPVLHSHHDHASTGHADEHCADSGPEIGNPHHHSEDAVGEMPCPVCANPWSDTAPAPHVADIAAGYVQAVLLTPPSDDVADSATVDAPRSRGPPVCILI